MAGHSKWANIQHRKGRQDAKRGKVFTKLIRALTVAARLGGGDVSANPRLRDAVEKAKNANMANDTIDRAIKKGAGGLEGNNMEEIIYEGYGPNGIAVMVSCLTDNRNRTVAEIRHAFVKCGGSLGTSGSVAYLFSHKGQMVFTAGTNEDLVIEVSLENEAEDVTTNEDGSIEITTTQESFSNTKDAMISAGLKPEHAEVNLVASTNVECDKRTAEKMLNLQDMLEDLDDVQNVYSNATISAEVLSELENGVKS